MPHERREDAEKRAQEVGIDKSQVTNSEAGYFIAPDGLETKTAKKVYAENRAKGMSARSAAGVAWKVEKKIKGEE